MSMICNRCGMLTEPMGHNCEFCGRCVGADQCPIHGEEPLENDEDVTTTLNDNSRGGE